MSWPTPATSCCGAALSPEPDASASLTAVGERVWVSPVRATDLAPYRLAVERSRPRLARWNPVNPDDLATHLGAQSRVHRTFVIRARRPEGEHDIVGKVNVTNVVHGRFLNGAMGYDAYDPYAGRGLFAEGMRLVIGLALAPEPQGMGLHRLEASVQPGNAVSAGLLRSMGFRHEGFTPRMLWLTDAAGREEWRDHDRYALTAEEWPAAPYATQVRRRSVVVVNGVPGSGKSALAGALAAELGVPLYSKDVVKEAVANALPADVVARHGAGQSALGAGASNALWALLAGSPVGGVVESWFWPHDERWVREGMALAGLDPAAVPEIWCDVSVDLARTRFEARAGERHVVHGPQVGLDDWWERVRAAAHPLGLGPVHRVDTSTPVSPGQVVRLALAVRSPRP